MNVNELIGVINIYKEKGYTSHDVVNVVRKTLGRVKAGHTGTLDPDAEGVLPICIGKATKIAELIVGETKEYRAELILGIETDTEDISGTVIKETEVIQDRDQIKRAVLSFVGDYSQIPPMYSAVKMGGRKLYQLAREGITVERQPRLIHIVSINIVEMQENKIIMDVLCSKGTYIRTLCADIGKKLGCGGCMGKLLRTKSGMFTVEDSIKLGDLKEKVENDRLSEVLIPIDKVLSKNSKVKVKEAASKYLYNGNRISFHYIEFSNKLQLEEPVLVYDFENTLVGIFKAVENEIIPQIMFR